MPLRQQDILSGKDTKLLRVELNKQNKKTHLHHSSPSNDTDVLILLIIFMRD